MKRTKWYAADVKPVRRGYYERDYLTNFLTAIPDYWDGRAWYLCNRDVRICKSREPRKWRGLAAPVETQPESKNGNSSASTE